MPRFQIRRFINSMDEMIVNARNSSEAYSTAKGLLDENTGDFEHSWTENLQIREVTVDDDLARLRAERELAELKKEAAAKLQHAPQPPRAAQPAKPAAAPPVARPAAPVAAKPARPVIPAPKPAAPAAAVKAKVPTREDLYKLAKSQGLPANTKMNVARLTALLAAGRTPATPTPTKG